MKDEMDLSKWNKCILNLECITVTTLLLTYLEQKHSFGNIYKQFKENLTPWLTDCSSTKLFSCLVLKFHELHHVLFLLLFIP